MTYSQITLLFRQKLFLSLLAGACCYRSLSFGLGLFLILFVVEGKTNLKKIALYFLSALIGFLVIYFTLSYEVIIPKWMNNPYEAKLIKGDIVCINTRSEGRFQLLLKNVHLLTADEVTQIKKIKPHLPNSQYQNPEHPDSLLSLPGKTSLTIPAEMFMEQKPSVGQEITALLKIYPLSGSHNFGMSNPTLYNTDRGVFSYSSLVNKKSTPLFCIFTECNDRKNYCYSQRELWREQFILSLERAQTSCFSFFNSQAEIKSRYNAEAFPIQGYAMLQALLFGDKTLLSAHTMELFTEAGLVHSLALSGQHLAIATLIGCLLISFVTLLYPVCYLTIPKKILLVFCALPFAGFYLYLGDAPFSLLRAAFMLIAAGLFLYLKKTIQSLDVLFFATALLFFIWPASLFDLSAQLSVLAVAGILLGLPLNSYFRRFFEVTETDSRKKIILFWLLKNTGSLLLMSIAAQLATFPLVIYTFGAISLSVWLNLLWLPFLGFITLPGTALAFLFLQVDCSLLAEIVTHIAVIPAQGIIFLLDYLDHRDLLFYIQCPRFSGLAGLGYGLLFLYFTLSLTNKLLKTGLTASKRLLCTGILTSILGLFPAVSDYIQRQWNREISVTVLDVGQGQSVLIETPKNRILVDGGGSFSKTFDIGKSIVAPSLTWQRLPHLDAVIGTHNDMDHVRGLSWILKHFYVDALCWSQISASRLYQNEAGKLHSIAQSKHIPEYILYKGNKTDLGDGIQLEVLAPNWLKEIPNEKKLTGNDASLVLYLTDRGKGLAMLCADMSAEGLDELSDNKDISSEILLLSHHGSTTGLAKVFFDAVHPDVAIASAAAFNKYHLPSEKIKKEMKFRKIPLLCTAQCGAIKIKWSRKGRNISFACPKR